MLSGAAPPSPLLVALAARSSQELRGSSTSPFGAIGRDRPTLCRRRDRHRCFTEQRA